MQANFNCIRQEFPMNPHAMHLHSHCTRQEFVRETLPRITLSKIKRCPGKHGISKHVYIFIRMLHQKCSTAARTRKFGLRLYFHAKGLDMHKSKLTCNNPTIACSKNEQHFTPRTQGSNIKLISQTVLQVFTCKRKASASHAPWTPGSTGPNPGSKFHSSSSRASSIHAPWKPSGTRTGISSSHARRMSFAS